MKGGNDARDHITSYFSFRVQQHQPCIELTLVLAAHGREERSPSTTAGKIVLMESEVFQNLSPLFGKRIRSFHARFEPVSLSLNNFVVDT